MKASYYSSFGGPDHLVYGDLPDPSPGPAEALIRVKACALNHLDYWLLQGSIPSARQLPHVCGSDVAGVVEAIGKKVSNVSVGDQVLLDPAVRCFACAACKAGNDNLCESFKIFGAGTQGGYAELTLARADHLFPLPAKLSFEEAAAFPLTFLTAYHMLFTRAHLQPKEIVLVHGAGSGVGVAAIQLAKRQGARVFATAGSDAKCEKALKLGADHAINYLEDDFAERVHALTQGKGVEVVFEHVGPTTFAGSLASLAPNGRLVTCGATTGPQVSFDLRPFYSKQLSILGSLMGTRADFEACLRLLEQGKVKPVVDSVFPLRDARKAMEKLLSRDVFGKIVLVP